MLIPKKIGRALCLLIPFSMILACSSSSGGGGGSSDTKYTITYSTERGTAPASVTVTDGDALTASQLPSLTATGYTFLGWLDGETLMKTGDTVKKDLALTAKWRANTYIIAFDANGGSGDVPASVSAEYDKDAKLPANSFTGSAGTPKPKGWMTSAKTGDDTEYYADNETVRNLTAEDGATVTLYARYSAGDYIVDFYDSDGKLLKSVEKNKGDKLTADDVPAKEHYTPTKYEAGGAEIILPYDVTSDLKVTVMYEIEKFTLTFTSDHGTVQKKTVTCDWNSTFAGFETLVDDDYTFNGWYYTVSSAETEAPASLTVTEDVEFTAKWIKKCVVTFKSEYGTLSKPEIKVDKDTKLSASDLETLSKTGWNFDGWFDAAGTSAVGFAVSADVTFTAKWSVFTRTVTFHANAVSGDTLQVIDSALDGKTEYTETFSYGEKAALGVCRWYSGSYYFTGWNTSADNSGTVYKDRADYTWTDANPTNGDTLSLYAQWQKKDMFLYEVTLPEPETDSAADITLSYNAAALTLTATKTGFTGTYSWYVDYKGDSSDTAVTVAADASGSGTFDVKKYVGTENVGIGMHSVVVFATADGFTYSKTIAVYMEYVENLSGE